MKRPSASFRRRQSGSTLLVALFASALIGVICAGLLVVTQANVGHSRRSFYNQTAGNLAESGIEIGLRALNAARSGSATAWDGWRTSGGNRTITVQATNLGVGATGQTIIAVLSPNSSQPQIAARGIVTLSDGVRVEEWSAVDTSARSLFSFGLLTRTSINMSGTSFADSWNSDPDSNPNTPSVQYPTGGTASSNAYVGCASSAQPSISLGNGGGIYGRAAVGASSASGVTMGWGAKIGPRNWNGNGQQIAIATNALVPNLVASFQNFSAPSGASLATSVSLVMDQTATLGANNATSSISMGSISLSGNSRLTIRGNVTLTLTSPSAISLFDSSRISLAQGASLTIYTSGGIHLRGDARMNCDNNPASNRLQIYGTGGNPSYQLYGSAAVYALVYAPNASLLLDGNAQWHGAAVVDRATLTGSSAFHQDEAIATTGPSDSLRVTAYRELPNATVRQPFAALLSP